MGSIETLANPQPVDATHWTAMDFVPGSSFFVSRVSLFSQDAGSTGDRLFVSVRGDDGSGSPAASNLTQGSAIGGTAGSWLDIDVAPRVQLLSGTTYWIVAGNSASPGDGYDYWDSSNLLGTGLISSDGIAWNAPLPLRDFTYRIYGFIQPSWSFATSQSVSSLAPAQTVVFRSDFTNAGPGDAAALWVNLTLPAELAYVSNDSALIGGVGAGTSYLFSSVAPGSYSFNVTASARGGFPNGTVASTTIRFDGTDHNGAPMATTTRVHMVTILGPRLTVSILSSASTMDPGDNVTLNVTATNVGAAAASNVLLEGTVDVNATFISAVSASYNAFTRTVARAIPAVAVGGRAWLEWVVQPPPGTLDGSTVRSVASATYEDATGTRLPVETASTVGTVRAPAFTPLLRVDRTSAEKDDTVAATFYFNNTGSVSAPTAAASWNLGENYAFSSLAPVTPFNTSANGFDIVWLGLAAGPHSIIARLRVLTGLSDGLPMPIQVRWSATDGNGNALPPVTRTSTVVLRAPVPAISVAPTYVLADAGAVFTLNLTLRNTGGAAAAGWLNATLPVGFTYVDDNGMYTVTVAGDRISWAIPVLASGASVTLGIELRGSEAANVSIRFTFEYTDGRGSPMASLTSNPAGVETVPVTAGLPVLPIVGGLGVAVAIGLVSAFLLLRRRKKAEPLVIDDAFVVNEAGVLLAHRSASFVQYLDEDILMGMFKIVQDFVKDSFSRGMDEEMQGLSFGTRRILIERGRHHFIAVVYRGGETEELRTRVKKVSQEIDERFGDTLANWNGVLESVRGISLILPQVWGQAS